MVCPRLPRGLWSHIVIRVFLLLGTVCPRHPPVLPSWGRSPICNPGTRVVTVVPQPSANLSHQQTPPWRDTVMSRSTTVNWMHYTNKLVQYQPVIITSRVCVCVKLYVCPVIGASSVKASWGSGGRTAMTLASLPDFQNQRTAHCLGSVRTHLDSTIAQL